MVDDGDTDPSDDARPRTHRRREILIATSAVAAGAAGWALRGVQASTSDAGRPQGRVSSADQVNGITYPPVPQRHLLATALTLAGTAAVSAALEAVHGLEVMLAPDAGEVTVTIGVAAPHARSLWPARTEAARDLPEFATDADHMPGAGDVVVQVCAETESAVRDVTDSFLTLLPDADVVWRQAGYRDAPTTSGTARTGIGFIDGIANPRSRDALRHGVWTGAPQRDTYMVMRRTWIDAAFNRMSIEQQEQAIGRRRDTGAPLSGGAPLDDVDLFVKAADGTLLTPVSSHARRAHPLNLGVPLMLRRSYNFSERGERGLLFVAFVSDPATFIATQRRIEESDDLIAHTRVDASGCYFVPGDVAAVRLTDR